MKKSIIVPIIMFVVFLAIDIGLIAFYESTHKLYIFLAATFLEIAIFGCIIIYEIMKQNEKKCKNKNEQNDEQIIGDGDKK